MSKAEIQKPNNFTIDDSIPDDTVTPAEAPKRGRGRPKGSSKKGKLVVIEEVERQTSLPKPSPAVVGLTEELITAEQARAMRCQLLEAEATQVITDICKAIRRDTTAAELKWPLDRSKDVRDKIVNILKSKPMDFNVADDGSMLTIIW